jgi:hypothetical protein
MHLSSSQNTSPNTATFTKRNIRCEIESPFPEAERLSISMFSYVREHYPSKDVSRYANYLLLCSTHSPVFTNLSYNRNSIVLSLISSFRYQSLQDITASDRRLFGEATHIVSLPRVHYWFMPGLLTYIEGCADT